ncbi:beta-lactamase/transpeptidase-like protein [Xylariaceae sp. FL1651]|nr:beta-lactamase/transpeptidase-like protein [Xylariaceae sp. FL1651]
MLRALVLCLAITAKALAASPNECVLAGPGYPSPSKFNNSSLLADAIASFEDTIKNKQLNLEPNDTAWAVALFSSNENKVLYERYYTPPVDVGVTQVDSNSIFRIASISKVFTVWSFLLEVGYERFNDPITAYVPELMNLTYSSRARGREVYNDIDHVRWNEITLGQLASHAAGIPRDPTGNELAAELSADQVAALGFPPLNKSEVPVCSADGLNRACTRKEALSYILKQHPLYPSAHSPAYSNYGFTLLSYAQEAITGVPLSTAMTKNIFGALGMNNSSYSATPSSGGVIPGGNASEVGWDTELGPTSPSGSIYSSTSDMVKAGQAILQSTLLSRSTTRRWMQPLIQTGALSTAVGAPWEIRYLTLPNGRVTQIPTKQGDVGTYHAALVLSPEHDLGFVVLAAGTTAANVTGIRDTLMDSLGDMFLPAAEQQAQEEAVANFAGTYVDVATNSSVTIQANPSGGAGLEVNDLVSHGVQVIGPESPLVQMFGAGQSTRLYPSNLKAVSWKENGSEVYDSRLGFRATYFNATSPSEVEDPCLFAWTALGTPLYGQVALDDWVFEMREDGQAEILDVRLLRLRMERMK